MALASDGKDASAPCALRPQARACQPNPRRPLVWRQRRLANKPRPDTHVSSCRGNSFPPSFEWKHHDVYVKSSFLNSASSHTPHGHGTRGVCSKYARCTWQAHAAYVAGPRAVREKLARRVYHRFIILRKPSRYREEHYKCPSQHIKAKGRIKIMIRPFA